MAPPLDGRDAMTRVRRPRPIALAGLGLALGVAGIVGYFLVVFRLGASLPRVRNDAVPNWSAIAVGVALSGLAVARASRGRRLVPGLLLGVNVVLAAAFAALLYVVPVVPAARGPALGVTAPDIALRDQAGKLVRLADFQGRPLVLVFYRGHW